MSCAAYAEFLAVNPIPYCGTFLPKPGRAVVCCATAVAKATRTQKEDMGKEPKDSKKRLAAMTATCTEKRVAMYRAMQGKGPLTRKQIAALLGKTSGAVQGPLARLVKSKHVRRREGLHEWVTFEWIAK